jgi:hypothetical protein
MTTPTETETKEILNAIARLESTTTALAQRVEIGFAQMTQRIEVGFAEVDTKLAKMETKLAETRAELKTDIQKVEGKLAETRAELGGKIDVLDERTQIGFWGFAARGAIATLLGTVGLTFLRWFWAIGIPKYFPQLLP